MQVLLQQDVKGVGRRGDIVNAADGYARNFLIPKGFALLANDGVKAQAATMTKAREARDVKDKLDSQAIIAKIGASPISVAARASKDGKLFGSVNGTHVAKAIQDQFGVSIDKHAIEIDHAKTTGTYEVPVTLPGHVAFSLNVEIVSA
jgi:large subunit ribosomal protein L9